MKNVQSYYLGKTIKRDEVTYALVLPDGTIESRDEIRNLAYFLKNEGIKIMRRQILPADEKVIKSAKLCAPVDSEEYEEFWEQYRDYNPQVVRPTAIKALNICKVYTTSRKQRELERIAEAVVLGKLETNLS